MDPRVRPWIVPAVPFAFSMALSISTVGSTVFWQDSGFYLTAIHDLAVSAPHGFVLYLLLAKAWTLVAAPVFGFTLAVHLFSSLCAATAAAFLAAAAEGFLKRIRPGAPCAAPAILAACVAAAGYSFWHSGILAKAYALFYALLAALLWILVRAESRRDFTALAIVLGLAWAAHPAAALLVPALLVYAWARRDRIREWGRGWFAGLIGIAAACAFVPSAVVLPWLSSRESLSSFAHVATAAEVVHHLRGGSFTDFEGAFGFDGARWALGARFVWEELLGVGLVILGLGFWRLGKEAPRALALVGSWIGVAMLVPLVFIGEGMFDMWFVIAYLPLALVTATGLSWIAGRAPAALPAVAGAAIAWCLVANYRDLNLRGYDLAELYGRLLLEAPGKGGLLVVSTDDAAVIPLYLQRVRGERPDVRLLHSEFMSADWYARRVERAHGVRIPRAEEAARVMPGIDPDQFWVTAFVNANAAARRPVYCERPPDRRHLRPDLAQVRAGLFWKVAMREEAAPDSTPLPLEPEAVAARRRRPRGQIMRETPRGMISIPEPYEDRLLQPLLQIRLGRAEPLIGKDPRKALEIFEPARALDPSLEWDAAFQYNYAMALHLCDRPGAAEDAFRKVLALDPTPARETMSHYYLAELALASGRRAEARTHFDRALQVGGVDEAMLDHIRRRAGKP